MENYILPLLIIYSLIFCSTLIVWGVRKRRYSDEENKTNFISEKILEDSLKKTLYFQSFILFTLILTYTNILIDFQKIISIISSIFLVTSLSDILSAFKEYEKSSLDIKKRLNFIKKEVKKDNLKLAEYYPYLKKLIKKNIQTIYKRSAKLESEEEALEANNIKEIFKLIREIYLIIDKNSLYTNICIISLEEIYLEIFKELELNIKIITKSLFDEEIKNLTDLILDKSYQLTDTKNSEIIIKSIKHITENYILERLNMLNNSDTHMYKNEFRNFLDILERYIQIEATTSSATDFSKKEKLIEDQLITTCTKNINLISIEEVWNLISKSFSDKNYLTPIYIGLLMKLIEKSSLLTLENFIINNTRYIKKDCILFEIGISEYDKNLSDKLFILSDVLEKYIKLLDNKEEVGILDIKYYINRWEEISKRMDGHYRPRIPVVIEAQLSTIKTILK